MTKEIEHLQEPRGIAGASGVIRVEDDLLIVSDDAAGCYFRVPISRDKALIPIPSDAAMRCDIPKDPAASRLALDLESIGRLADGRLVVLSERLRCLLDEGGIVAQYDDAFSELAEKGLEGLAVREEGEASNIAALWEGGYLDTFELPVGLRAPLGGHFLHPVVCIHHLEPDDRLVKVRVGQSEVVTLLVPNPPPAPVEAKNRRAPPVPPLRFRAPDLVWHRWTNDAGDRKWGFIVLLSSETPPYLAPDDEKPRKRYGPRWLQRFDLKGNPVGKPLDLDEAVRAAIGSEDLDDANWEGLAWFEEGKHLVLVHDESKVHMEQPAAVVIALPPSWRTN